MNIKDRIIFLVENHQGMKAPELGAKLATEFMEFSMDEILLAIDDCIMNRDVIEIEYFINSKSKSFLLPKGTHVEIK